MVQTQPALPPGSLKLIKGTPNPRGAKDVQLFLFVGDPTNAPIRHIIPDEGLTIPGPREDLSVCPFHLKILHINDLHGHISRFTPYGDQPVFSKIAWRLREIRSRRDDNPHAAILAMSAGDDLVGAVFDELLGDDSASYIAHAGYRLYSAAGLDVGILGNHDLDMGNRLLAHAIRQDVHFPLLSANLIGCRWLSGLIYPAALLVVKGLRVGIIGLITPTGIKPQLDTGLHVTNPIQVAHNLLPAMRPFCDVLIILSHLGYSLDTSSAAVSEAGDVELARSLPPDSAHLIIGGHTHNVLNEQGLSAYNIINGIPIVQAGTLGRFIGEVDITVQHNRSAVTNVRLTPTADLPIDEEFEQQEVQPLVELAHPLFARSLGQVVDYLDLSTDVVRNAFATGESALANFITDALVIRSRANGHDVDIAIIDASNVRCGLPIGELTFGDWLNVMPFADTIRLYWITGHQLKGLLNDNACRADRPGEPRTERGFLHFSRQVRYVIELGQYHCQAKATQISVNGISIDEQLDRSFLVACSSFVRQAAAAWEKSVTRSTNLPLVDIHTWARLDTNLFLRDELITYIRKNGGVTEQGGAKHDGRVQIFDSNLN